MCNRFFPDPLGIVLWYVKLEFDEERPGIEQHCHSEPVRFPGVAIPWLEVLLFVDEFRETAQKGQSV